MTGSWTSPANPFRSSLPASAIRTSPLVARVLDGRAIAAKLWTEIEAAAEALARRTGGVPRLGVLRVGDDPASAAYARQISRAFAAHKLSTASAVLPADAGQATVALALAEFAADAAINGILLQLPLPADLDAESLVEAMPLQKDVEGLHPYHVGRLALRQPGFIPSTPLAGLEILRCSGIPLVGRTAVVVGRSQIVGRPMASLLVQSDCTVIVCHTRTPDLGDFTRQADILIAAAGRAGLIRGEMLKPGVVVIDFGTNDLDGQLVGDVHWESASTVASALTPVPGGTGPVTTALLGRNLLKAAEAQLSLD